MRACLVCLFFVVVVVVECFSFVLRMHPDWTWITKKGNISAMIKREFNICKRKREKEKRKKNEI